MKASKFLYLAFLAIVSSANAQTNGNFISTNTTFACKTNYICMASNVVDKIAHKIQYAKQLRDCKQFGASLDTLTEAVEEMHKKQVEDNEDRKADTSLLLDMISKLMMDIDRLKRKNN